MCDIKVLMGKNRINSKSLKDQVYEYLRDEIRQRKIAPGSAINMELTSKRLGISKTPLRDALLQLEYEGFVKILPRRGILVKSLELNDIKNIYQIIGALESSALRSSFKVMTVKIFSQMDDLNLRMEKAIKNENFSLFYKLNLKFHNLFVDLCGNAELIKTINILKKRLYDFPTPKKWIREWEENSIVCHKKIVDYLKEGDIDRACSLISEDHWSFSVQQKYIKLYYFENK